MLGEINADCCHCESFSLASLRSRIAFFSESDSAPRALPSFSSQGPARKRQRGRGFERPETSELTSAQCPHASPSPKREGSPVLFTQPDQYPSAAASDMISFGASDDDMDDSLSLAASDAEELSGWVTDPALLPPSSSRSARPRTDDELVRVISKAVGELGLEWSPPQEPSRSRLDEWFLPGRQQAPRHRSSPFFPEVHDELTKSWRAPYASRIRPSASSAHRRFLQEMLDKQRSSSTIKVYAAAIAAFHAPIAGRSVGRNSAVVQFIRGARRMNPPRPRTVPPWDLPTVLRALKGPPFEPLQSTSLRSLSFKTALLLALASVSE